MLINCLCAFDFSGFSVGLCRCQLSDESLSALRIELVKMGFVKETDDWATDFYPEE